MPPGEGGNHPAGVNQPGPRWAMTKKQSGCLAVGELTQSLKKRLGLPCPLHRVLAAETGAPNGSTKKDELSGSIDLETRGGRLMSKWELVPFVSSHLPPFKWSPTCRAVFTSRPRAALTSTWLPAKHTSSK